MGRSSARVTALFCPQNGQRGGQERVAGYICVADVPATTPITLRRGQEILAGDWYAFSVSIEKGTPCM